MARPVTFLSSTQEKPHFFYFFEKKGALGWIQATVEVIPENILGGLFGN